LVCIHTKSHIPQAATKTWRLYYMSSRRPSLIVFPVAL
jgi:hypothetical protein